MPYQLSWVVPNRVILTTFTGVVSKTELQQYIAEITREVHKGEQPLYQITNSLALEKVQMSLKAFGDLIRSVSAFTGLTANIDINKPRAITTFLATVASQFVRVKLQTVPTLAEAIDVLKRIDRSLETLPWALPTQEQTDEPVATERN